MIRPGTSIVESDAAPGRASSTATDTLFVAGLTAKGTTAPKVVESLTDFDREYGGRVTYSTLRDDLEAAFAIGLRRAMVRRVVGAAAVKASVILKDSGAANSIKVEAVSVGDWANGATGGLKVAVVAGDGAGEFRLSVLLNGVEVERSPSLVDVAAAVEWSTASAYVRVTAQGANDPAVVAATNLTAGTDDRAAITDPIKVAALDDFRPDYGPGQVAVSGGNSDTIRLGLGAHAVATNRFAPADVPADDAGAAAAVQALRVAADPKIAERVFPVGDDLEVPGAFPGSTRVVSGSIVVAALLAAMDALGNPNEPAAGLNGRVPYAVGAVNDRSEANIATRYAAGVNSFRLVDGEPRLYGFRTAADENVRPLHVQANNVRTDMAVAAIADGIAERFMFRQLDGKRRTIAQFGNELSAALAPLETVGALYATDTSPAYRVEVGPTVNSDDSIARGELHAAVAIRRSPHADAVVVEITKTPITENV